MRHLSVVLMSLLIGSAALVSAADEKKEPAAGAAGPAAALPPPEISFVTVAKRSLPVTFETVGITEASRVVEVRARIRGYIEKRNFEEGATVKEGDLLYLIDQRPFLADVEVERARVQQAEARLSLAEREYARLSSLKEIGAAAQQDYDKAVSERDQALASLRLAKADLEKANLELNYTEIKAPLTGIVGKTKKEVGSMVDTGDEGLLTEITRISPLYASMRISERDYLAWKQESASGAIVLAPGQKERFQVVLGDGTVFPEEGVPNYEASSFRPETGTFEVRAQFENAQGILKPGQFIRARVVGYERPDTIAVPQRSVFQVPTGAFVYAIDKEDKIEFRPVTVGSWVGTEWVVKSGLAEGDRVLAEGFMKVQPGVKVTAVPYEAKAHAAGAPAGKSAH